MYFVRVSNLEHSEYNSLLIDLDSSNEIGKVEDHDQLEWTVDIRFPTLQQVINLVKYLSENYDNPEFDVLEQAE